MEPLLPKKVTAKAKYACGCLAKGNVRIIYDDWRKVPKPDKDFIWDNWIKIFRVPRGTEPQVKTWVMKTTDKSFKDWKSDLNMQYVQKGLTLFRTWGMITPDDWNAFVQKKSTEASKLLNKQRSEQAKKTSTRIP